jgi:glycosyltransferase 2 family protein
MNFNKILRNILFLIGVLMLIFLLNKIDISVLFSLLKTLSSYEILIIVFLSFFPVLIKSSKWVYLNEKMLLIKLPFSFSFKSNLAGIASSVLTPGRSDIAKSIILSEKFNINLSKSFSTLIVDRLMDFLAVLLFIIVSLFFISFKIQGFDVALVISILLFILLCSFFIFSKYYENLFLKILNYFPIKKTTKSSLSEKLSEVFSGLNFFSKHPQLSFVLFSYSLIWMSSGIFRTYYIFNILNLNIPLQVLTFAITFSLLIGIFAFVPGGIGVTEFSFVGILVYILGSSHLYDLMGSAVLLDRFFSFYLIIFVGLLFLFRIK